MVRTILKWLIIAVVVFLVVFWLLAGGIGKIINRAESLNFSFTGLFNASSSLSSFQLPFTPTIPQISLPESAAQGSGQGQPAQMGVPASTYANPSPYAGEITIMQDSAQAQAANAQYIELVEEPGAGVPINISGWTLRSPLSGKEAVIPEAASPFIMGRVNTVAPVSLAPGATVIVISGPSPIGTSFSENICTGYLGTLQPFTPALSQSCPAPSSEIGSDNGSACAAYAATLPPCTFPASPPSDLSSACISELQTKLSYNGCVSERENTQGFSENSWRIYLAHETPIWSDQHDVIQLLDTSGRVVDAINY